MKLDKQKIPRFKFTPKELFSCNPVIEKRIMKTERKILDFWKNLLQGELLENGIEITYRKNVLYKKNETANNKEKSEQKDLDDMEIEM